MNTEDKQPKDDFVYYNDEQNNKIGKDKKIFTLTLDKHWNTSKDLLKKEYKIISEIRKTEEGFECEIEEINIKNNKPDGRRYKK